MSNRIKPIKYERNIFTLSFGITSGRDAISGFPHFGKPVSLVQIQPINDVAWKHCSASDVDKTLARYFQSPVAFMIASMGGDSRRVQIVGKDGKEVDNAEAIKQSIPYKPLEIR